MAPNQEDTVLTPTSQALFLDLAHSAGDWSGTPLVEVTKEERGNLTQLKRAKLLETMISEGDAFAVFTDKGIEYASTLGIDLSWIDWRA